MPFIQQIHVKHALLNWNYLIMVGGYKIIYSLF